MPRSKRCGADAPQYHQQVLDVRRFETRRLGLVEYEAGLALQQQLVEDRRAGKIGDTLLLLEHPPVITLGVKTRGKPTNVVATAANLGIPIPAFATALAYYDGYRRDRLPANLLQAQRDYFGAHTYERIDKPGSFHSDWIRLRKQPS